MTPSAAATGAQALWGAPAGMEDPHAGPAARADGRFSPSCPGCLPPGAGSEQGETQTVPWRFIAVCCGCKSLGM